MNPAESKNDQGAFDSASVRTINKNGKSFKVILTKYAEFWSRFENGTWEPTTFKIFDDFATPDYCCLDIGSWIGPTVLYAAPSAKWVYAFEPDPLAYRELAANINANKDAAWASRIKIYNQAIAVQSGTVKIGNRYNVGDSMSSILFSDKNASWDVEALTLGQFLAAEQLQNEKLFIKIDIEGGEYDLVPTIKDILARPGTVLFLSVHSRFLSISLFPGKNGIWTKLVRRAVFVRKHINLVRALPFKYFYRNDGRPVNLSWEIMKSVFTRHFVDEIVARNEKWR